MSEADRDVADADIRFLWDLLKRIQDRDALRGIRAEQLVVDLVQLVTDSYDASVFSGPPPSESWAYDGDTVEDYARRVAERRKESDLRRGHLWTFSVKMIEKEWVEDRADPSPVIHVPYRPHRGPRRALCGDAGTSFWSQDRAATCVPCLDAHKAAVGRKR